MLRRDVRRFRRDPLPAGMLEDLVRLSCLAPSVGFSQPWRWIQVNSPERRQAIIDNFQVCNQQALDAYTGTQAGLYARLKLAGLVEAPVHLAVFIDPETQTGHRLGIRTMPEMLSYSAVCAVHTLWLVARAAGIGMGWVSILDPAQVRSILDVPVEWKLIAYLCLGYPEEEQDRPELETQGWETRQFDWTVPLAR
jgi:5,6-dimethylbenzimidazole synthase